MKLINCTWKIENNEGEWSNNGLHQDKVNKLPMMMRRRLTPLGLRANEILYSSLNSINQLEIPWVVACRHGDLDRTERLYVDINNKELLSPTDFSMSVHNAIIGMFSISTKNRKMHTVLSGSSSSFELGMLEAFALQQEMKSKVGYIYYDTILPNRYLDKFSEKQQNICIAMIFGEKTKDKTFSNENSSKNINIYYIDRMQDNLAGNNIGISRLTKFLKQDEKYFELPVAASGCLRLERHI